MRSKIRWLQLGMVGVMIFTSACRIPPEMDNANIVLIEGRVNEQGIDEVVIDRFSDNPYSIDQKKFSTIIDSSSWFYFKIPIEVWSSGRINFGDFSSSISVRPGDQLFIEFRAGEIKFTGIGSEKNIFLNELRTENLDESQISEAFNASEMPPEEFLSLIIETRSKQQEILSTYIGEIDPGFATYFNVNTWTTALMLLQNYPYMYSRTLDIELDSITLSDQFERLYQLKSIVNDSFVISPHYSNILNTSIILTSQQLVDNGKFPTIEAARNAVIFDSLSQKTKEYYLARTIGLFYILDRVDTILINEFDRISKDSLAIKAVAVAKNRFDASH